MKMGVNVFLVVFMCFLVEFANSHNSLFEGESCVMPNGAPGICTNIQKCKSAREDIFKEIMPQTCSFVGSDPIVCCVDNVRTTLPLETTTAVKWATGFDLPESTTVVPDKPDSKFLGKEEEDCPPIQSTHTAPKTGRKAWDKCIDYQEQLVYPCEKTLSRRVNNCWNDINVFIIDGEDSYEGEFPHMALIGFGDPPEPANFPCGATLISDKFLLTAGHCTSSRGLGPVKHALIGALTRTNYNQSNLHKIKTVFKHPNYKPPIKYHDIALLELETRIVLDAFTVPACLDVGDVEKESAIATGWGVTSIRGQSSDVLQKVQLSKFEDMECAVRYLPTRHLQSGFDSKSQLCYGDKTLKRDTCQGDSGGPLQVKNKRIHCMYSVIGITSFGRGCGAKGEPALYTRVSNYIDWIEGIVWPDPA